MRTGAGASVRSQLVSSCTVPPPGRRPVVGPRPFSAPARGWQSVAMTCPTTRPRRRRRARRAVDSRTTSSAGSSAGRTCGRRAGRHPGQQGLHGVPAERGQRRRDRGQRGRAELGAEDVVEPDDAHVPRHPHPRRRQPAHQADRDEVVVGHDRGDGRLGDDGRDLRPARRASARTGPNRCTRTSSASAASRIARQRMPSAQEASGPATYPMLRCSSSARCSIARRVPRALSVMTLGMPVRTPVEHHGRALLRHHPDRRVRHAGRAQHHPLDERERTSSALRSARRRLVHVRHSSV